MANPLLDSLGPDIMRPAYDRSRVPLYIQVAAVMRQRIERKQWQPGQKISTLEELEREFEVARVTVRQAIDLLREEGLLRCQQGRGTFISDDPPRRRCQHAAELDGIDLVGRGVDVDEERPRARELDGGDGRGGVRVGAQVIEFVGLVEAADVLEVLGATHDGQCMFGAFAALQTNSGPIYGR